MGMWEQSSRSSSHSLGYMRLGLKKKVMKGTKYGGEKRRREREGEREKEEKPTNVIKADNNVINNRNP